MLPVSFPLSIFCGHSCSVDGYECVDALMGEHRHRRSSLKRSDIQYADAVRDISRPWKGSVLLE